MDGDGGEGVGLVTCMACAQRLVGAEERREHYRSDWHRVNLKRKVAGLTPLPQGEYHARLATLAAEQETQAAAGGRRCAYCEVCSKRFAGEKALQQHLVSRRHLEKAASLQPDRELDDAVDETDEEKQADERMVEVSRVPADECVFCGDGGFPAEDEALVFMHMAKKHGMFVPYVESLFDPAGLLEYLAEKVGIGFACVCCDKSYSSLEAVRAHMESKSHTKMVEDDDAWCLEYAPFYAIEDEGAVEDMELSGEVAEDPNSVEVGLVLSDGRVAGHRSLHKIYRQNPMGGLATSSRVAGEYRLLGRHGVGGVSQQEIVAVRPPRQIVEKMRRANLSLGMSNYYTRKARVKTSFTVLNSGYRP